MKKESHITEFSAKRGDGLHIRVTTSRGGRRIAVDGGRLYYRDYPSKHEAMRRAKAIRDEILRDLDLRPRTTVDTVSVLLDKSYELFPVAQSTRSAHEYIYENYLSDLSDKPITAVSLKDIQQTVTKYAETHEQGRIKRIIAIWSRIYRTAIFSEIPVPDLPKLIITPRSKVLKQERDMSLDPAEFDRMLAELSCSKSWKARTALSLCWVMYYTGMRTAEALALSEEDVDLERSVIRIRKQVGSTASKSAQIIPTKTAGSVRTIPIAEGLRPVLEALLDEADGLLFCDPDGGIVSPESMTMYIGRIAHAKGIRFSLYRLRHMFSADLLRQGTNIKVIQSLMGHNRSAMSLYYAYSTEADRVEAIAKRRPS